MDFKPRLTVPIVGDLNYTNVAYGGKNKCIARDPKGFVLPNCTGYAWGRALEAWGSCNLPTTDAENWYPNAVACGYQIGSEPKVGAVICWRKGQAGVHSDGAGHVAFVESVNGDKVLWSQSDYSGTVANGRFWRLLSGRPETYFSGLTFQGYIYAPDLGTIGDPVPRDESRLQVEVVANNLNGRLYPSISGSKWGKFVTQGVYNIYDSKADSERVWYEIQQDVNGIGDNLWCASDGCKLLPPTTTDYERLYRETLEELEAVKADFQNYKKLVASVAKELDALV